MTEYTCLNDKLINQLWLVTSSSQYCPIDDSQVREGTKFISYSLAVQATQKYSDLEVLFAVLHLRWLPSTFNHSICNCQSFK